MPTAPPHILTVDVEDWFHILEVEGGYGRGDWSSLESRVEANTDRLLELLAESGARATFFVVGWVAWRLPALVRRIAAAGHELGSHSFWHEVVRAHDRASLSADAGRSRRLLEDLSGTRVRGFRAPGASITPETAWAFDVIAEQGYAYDSSVCPGYASHGGFASPYHAPHWVRCNAGELAEIPSATVGLGRRRIPYAGGGYLRLFPYRLIRAWMRHDARRARPVPVYVHPREIDPEQPRLPLPPLRRFKYYVGLGSTERKLRALLRDHRFLGAGAWLDAHEDRLAGRVLDVRALAAVDHTPDPARIPPPPPDPAALVSGAT